MKRISVAHFGAILISIALNPDINAHTLLQYTRPEGALYLYIYVLSSFYKPCHYGSVFYFLFLYKRIAYTIYKLTELEDRLFLLL